MLHCFITLSWNVASCGGSSCFLFLTMSYNISVQSPSVAIMVYFAYAMVNMVSHTLKCSLLFFMNFLVDSANFRDSFLGVTINHQCIIFMISRMLPSLSPSSSHSPWFVVCFWFASLTWVEYQHLFFYYSPILTVPLLW